jgi:hypothetical protein
VNKYSTWLFKLNFLKGVNWDMQSALEHTKCLKIMIQFSDNMQFLTVIMLLRKALQLELEQGLCTLDKV